MSDATQILKRVQEGDPKAAAELLPLVYEELRKLAAGRMAHEVPGQTLQATALVHEAWLRLVGNQNQKWDGRAHFFGAAAEAMRRILIENARRKRAARHGGGQQRVDVQALDLAASTGDDDTLLAVSEALDKLAVEHKLEADLVKLRFYVGLTNEDAAEMLGISARTAHNYWTHASAWLYREIRRDMRDA